MTLKVNSSYKTIAGGYIIPRSLWSHNQTPKYAIFDVLQIIDGRYVKKTTVYDVRQCRKLLGLTGREGITIC